MIVSWRTKALPSGEGGRAKARSGEVRQKPPYSLHLGEFVPPSSVSPSGCHLPQRGRLWCTAKRSLWLSLFISIVHRTKQITLSSRAQRSGVEGSSHFVNVSNKIRAKIPRLHFIPLGMTAAFFVVLLCVLTKVDNHNHHLYNHRSLEPGLAAAAAYRAQPAKLALSAE